MRYLIAQIACLALLTFTACSVFQAKQPPQPPPPAPAQISFPVGKKWQVKEEAPTLTNELHERTLPLQREESIQPPGPPPAPPTEQHKIETPR